MDSWNILHNFSYFFGGCGISDWELQNAANITEFIARWMPPVQAHECVPNGLAIMQKAVNTPKKPRVIFQPCWSARRWKSTT